MVHESSTREDSVVLLLWCAVFSLVVALTWIVSAIAWIVALPFLVVRTATDTINGVGRPLQKT